MLDIDRFCNNIFIIELLYICYKLFSCTLSSIDIIVILHIFLYLILNKPETKNEIYDLLTYSVLPFTLLYEYSIIYDIDMIIQIFRIFELIIIALSDIMNKFVDQFMIVLGTIIVIIGLVLMLLYVQTSLSMGTKYK
jgi:hypothetical protein